MKRFKAFASVLAWLAGGLAAGPLAATPGETSQAPSQPLQEAVTAADALAHEAAATAADQFRRAQAYSDAGQAEAALAAVARAVELEPDNVEYLRGLARVAGWTGDYETAQRSWERILALVGEDREAALGYARTAAWSGRTDKAAKLYRDYVARYPDDAEARLEYVRVRVWQGNAADALEILETYREDFGPSDAYREERARVLTAGRRSAAALAALAPLVAAEPESYRRRRLLALALADHGEPEQALANLETLRLLAADNPATREVERLVETPLRSTVAPHFELYSDSDSVDVSRLALEGNVALSPRSWLGIGIERQELSAAAASGLAARGGETVRGTGGWLGVRRRFSPRLTAEGRLGGADVEGGDELTTYRLGLRFDPSDVFALELERQRGFYAVSPLALERGIHRTGNQLRLDWRPGLRTWVEATAAWDDFSDGNRRREVTVAPRRQVLRRQRFNLDLGLRAWWFAFDDDLDHGYYDPSSYERYAFTGFGYWKIDDQNGVGLVLSLGWLRDDAMGSFRFGGDLAVEGTFGVYRDWMLVVRLGATENSRTQTGAFNAYGGRIALTRRFGGPAGSGSAS